MMAPGSVMRIEFERGEVGQALGEDQGDAGLAPILADLAQSDAAAVLVAHEASGSTFFPGQDVLGLANRPWRR